MLQTQNVWPGSPKKLLVKRNLRAVTSIPYIDIYIYTHIYNIYVCLIYIYIKTFIYTVFIYLN